MAAYPVDIAALPPLASGVNDTPAPPIVQGDFLQLNHVNLATDQYKNRKRLFNCSAPLATNEEVMASKRRKCIVESANFVGGDVPPWAQGLQQQMANMGQKMANMRQQMANMATQDQMANMQEQIVRVIRQEAQRSINLSRKSTLERIEMVLRLEDGQLPVPPIWFPNDQDALMLAQAHRIDPLLAFYCLDLIGTLTDRKRRLMQFLGVTH